MERTVGLEERIRRAEEIYNRRKMQNSGVRVSTTRVNTSFDDKYKLYKKLILQIAICFIIYFIFYLIKNSNYLFSEDLIKKTREFLSYDINFGNTYNSIMQYYNDNFKSNNMPAINSDDQQTVNEILNENVNVEESVGGMGRRRRK